MPEWFNIQNAASIPSPSLVVYPDRMEENIRHMIALAGDVSRLRPHLKTNKMPRVTERLLAAGIQRFKCATVAEADMAASAGATDVLLAYPVWGPNADRLIQLQKTFPKTRFSTLCDHPDAARALSHAAAHAGTAIAVLLDIDCGQHRTGIAPGLGAMELYQHLGRLPGLIPGGLHVYDGHIHEADPRERATHCDAAFAPVQALWDELIRAGCSVPRVVAGGTPTFPIHARRAQVECSPGTCVFWDYGYGSKFKDLDFLIAALVLTRVVSKPTPDRLCLDLGTKAVASEMAHPRVVFPQLPDAKPVAHNEEHLVLETASADAFPLGSVLYGLPWHICPTVNLYAEAVTVRAGLAGERWDVTARARRLHL